MSNKLERVRQILVEIQACYDKPAIHETVDAIAPTRRRLSLSSFFPAEMERGIFMTEQNNNTKRRAMRQKPSRRKAVDIDKDERHDFRLMAANADLLEEVGAKRLKAGKTTSRAVILAAIKARELAESAKENQNHREVQTN